MHIKFNSHLIKITKQAALIPVIIFFIGAILLQENMNTALYVIGELLLIWYFYSTFAKNTLRWSYLSTRQFLMKAFTLSIGVRFIAILIVYFIQHNVFIGREVFIYPDSWNYHAYADTFANKLPSGIIPALNSLGKLSFDDRGYPIILGFTYRSLGAVPFSGKILNILFGSFSVILIYKTARIIYNEKIARTAAIISALFPYLIYYTGLLMKEVIMVYFLLLAFYFFYRVIYQRASLINFIILGFAIISLMFFRLIIGALVIAIFTSYLVIFLSKGSGFASKMLISSIFLLSVVFFITLLIPEAVDRTKIYYEQRYNIIQGDVRDLNNNEQIKRTITKDYLSSLVLLAAPLAPFPSFAKIPKKEFTNIHFAAALIKITIIFFYYYGVFWTITKLENDWKIYVFGNRFYIFKRPILKGRGFRASGGGYDNYFYDEKAEQPDGILEFAQKISKLLKIPHLSLDVGYDGERYHLLELQAVYFGTAGIVYSDYYYDYSGANLVKVTNEKNIEQAYVDSILQYLKAKIII